MYKRGLVLASLIGLALLTLFWIFDPGSETEAAKKGKARGAPVVHADRARSALAGKQEQAIEGAVRKELSSSQAVAVLELRILKEDGKPAKGTVFWTTSQAPIVSSSQMAPEQGQQLPANVQTVSHTGSARLEIPAGHWTWLRVTDHGADHFTTCAYARIKPFAGQHTRLFRLSPGVRIVVA